MRVAVTTAGVRFPLAILSSSGWMLWGNDGIGFYIYAENLASFTLAKVVPA